MSPSLQPERELTVDKLKVKVYDTRQSMGRAAALDVAQAMRACLEEQQVVRMVFAAAPSQNEFLAELALMPDLAWGRVEAFHMDEYVGLPADAPQRFGNFLRVHLFDRVRPGRVEYLDGMAADAEQECARYAGLLQERDIDIVCAGIGENGHMAFNDPHVADFDDPQVVKVVTLDEVCRTQQVHDGAFPTVDDVPKQALTMTMSALMAAERIACVVPGPTKTDAVYRTLHSPVSEACPATAMRRHDHAILYLDAEAAARM